MQDNPEPTQPSPPPPAEAPSGSAETAPREMIDPSAQQGLDDALQRELDEALGGMSLEDLIDAEEAVSRRADTGPPAAGGVRRGRVIAIHGDDIFVDMGGKSQGVAPAMQFAGGPLPKVGDWVELTITGYDSTDGLLLLSRQGAVTAAAWASVEEGQIVEGRVTGHNKGGLELDIDGIKAFMPISQIEQTRVEEISGYVNRRLRCMITEVRRDERALVVSRRDVLDMETAEAARQTFESLTEGKLVRGTVKTIMPYGAFVDIGGIDGLLHVRDMGYSRVEKPSDVVQEGQQLELMVLKIDRDARRISLGLKQVMPDPWADAAAKWPPDTLVTGRITRLEEFGAFVELTEGVEGLIPIGELTFERRVRHPSEIVQAGDVVRVRVMSVEPERRRVSLSLKRVGDDPWVGASARWPVDSIVEGVVTRISDFGAFVQLTAGVEGLVHISELSDERVRMVSDAVREGQTVQAKVLDVEEERRRISLSIKQAAAAIAATMPEVVEPAQPASARKRKKPLKGGLEW
jgi:small subunit ribosomal protein S1